MGAGMYEETSVQIIITEDLNRSDLIKGFGLAE